MWMSVTDDLMFMVMVVVMCLSHVRSMGIYNRAALIRWCFEMLLQPCENGVQPGTILEVGKDEWPFAAHAPRVTLHHLQRSFHVRCQVNFVDDQQVGAGDARTAFARDFVAPRNIDHVDKHVHQFRAESGGQVVATALAENEFKSRHALSPLPHPSQLHHPPFPT